MDVRDTVLASDFVKRTFYEFTKLAEKKVKKFKFEVVKDFSVGFKLLGNF